MAEEEDEYQPPPPSRWQRWRRRLAVIAFLLLIAACVGEWLISRTMATRLREMVESKLDARLEVGSVLYVPPYGAWAWNVRLMRGSSELLRLDKIAVNLANLPLREGAPIVISSLAVDRPVLNFTPGAFDGMGKSGTKPQSPQKLSEMLRLNRIRLADGRIVIHGGAEPVTWNNLSFDADLSQQSPSRYSFRLLSRAAPLVDANVAGSIDVDELVLDAPNISLKAHAEPDPKSSPLPADVQSFIKKYQITGGITLGGTARIPLREPNKASCLITVALQEGSAVIPGENIPLERARASIVCHKSPGGGVQVKVDTIALAGMNQEAMIEGGIIDVDPSAGKWRLTEMQGRVNVKPPTTAPTTRRGPLDDLAPVGRVDFTIVAEGPIDLRGRKPLEAIRHELIAYPRNFSFHLPDFAKRFDKAQGGEVRVVNGTLIFQELNARYGDDEIRIRGARLPLSGLPKVERWQEISGAIIFRPPLSRYTPKLDRILDLINPSGGILVAGNYTSDTSGATPRQDYDLILSSDTASVTVTSRHITASKIRGDATLTPAGVELHGVEAEVLGGKVRANGIYKVTEGDHPDTYAGDLVVTDLELSKLEERLRDTPPAKPMGGRAYGEASFSGAIKGEDFDSNVKALAAGGQFEMLGGSLYTLPVLRNITQQIRGLKQATTVGDAATRFEIAHGEVRLEEVAVNSPVLGLQGGGTINMLDGKLNLDVVAAPLADWRDKLQQMRVPIIGDIAGNIAGGIQKMLNTATGSLLYAFRVTGSVKDVKVAAVPAPVLTDAAANVFGRMINPIKGERPLDWLKSKFHREPTSRPAR